MASTVEIIINGKDKSKAAFDSAKKGLQRIEKELKSQDAIPAS